MLLVYTRDYAMNISSIEKRIQLTSPTPHLKKLTQHSINWLKQCREMCLKIYINKDDIKNHLPYLTQETILLIQSLYELTNEHQSYSLSPFTWSSDPYLMAFKRWCSHESEFHEFHPEIDASQQAADAYWKMLLGRLLTILDSDLFRTERESLRRLRSHHTKKLVDDIIHFKCAYTKIMIIRVDLGFSKNSSLGKPWIHANSNDIIKPLAKLCDWMRADQRGSYLHHSFKLELGVDKGLHAHALFILNASKVREDETIGALIVEQWRKITDGQGIGFNCNTANYKARLTKCALGVFGEVDQHFKNNVKKMVSYLAKPDYLLRIAYPDVRRIVRSSTITSEQRMQQEMRPIYQQRKQKIIGQPWQ